MTHRIELHDIEFHAFHGVYPEEKRLGQLFRVNLDVDADYSKAMISDELSDAIDYVELYGIVKDEMRISSNLLEHVVGRIISRLRTEFKAITRIDIKITKVNPPIDGQLAGISIHVIDTL